MLVNDRAQEVANIRAIAEAELKQEQIKKAVSEMKEKLRRGSWLTKLFPWKIVVVRRDV